MGSKKKIRAEFRKNRGVRARRTDWTRQFHNAEDDLEESFQQTERISGKGELARKRTVRGERVEEPDQTGLEVRLEVDLSVCRAGRVLAVHGLLSQVQAEDGTIYQCATRRLLKTLSTDQRHVVAVGDRVLFRPIENTDPPEGVIERIEPRRGTICRESKGRQQVLVTNVDQLVIVASADEPPLKPNLIDRLLVAAEKGGVEPRGKRFRDSTAHSRNERPTKRGGRPEWCGQVVAAECHRSRAQTARASRESGDPQRPPHHQHRAAVSAGLRGLRGRYPGGAPVPALGRDSRGSGRAAMRATAGWWSASLIDPLRQPLAGGLAGWRLAHPSHSGFAS